MSLTPKSWDDFQHYKDRSPSWIKLHRKLLDDFDYNRLPLASRALAPMLWLIASEYDHGNITATIEELAFRLRVTEDDLRDGLIPLIEKGFFIDASNTLAACKRPAIPEKEREIQVKTEKNIRAVVPTRSALENQFESFWKVYPRRGGANPKSPAFKVFKTYVAAGVDPMEIIAGAKRCAERESSKIGTEFIPQAVKWLRDRRWEDYNAEDVKPLPSAITGFYAAQDSPELDAWDAHHRATKGRNAPRDKNAGWWFPTQWPPGHQTIQEKQETIAA